MSVQTNEITILPDRDKQEFATYLYERENAKATIDKYLTDVTTFMKYLNGDYIITKAIVLQYKEWLCENYASNSVNSMLAALNQFLEFMGASALKVKRLKIQKQLMMSAEKEMTKEEYESLIKIAAQKGKTQLVMGMETLAVTGARISELAFFTVENIKKGMVEIHNKGKNRSILIPNSLKKKLLYYIEKCGIQKGRIFVTRTGKPIDRSNFWREMNALAKEANIDSKKVFPHNLRHLFARSFYKLTKDLAGLADILGHSSLDVTRIYTASTGEMYRKQIEMLGFI